MILLVLSKNLDSILWFCSFLGLNFFISNLMFAIAFMFPFSRMLMRVRELDEKERESVRERKRERECV